MLLPSDGAQLILSSALNAEVTQLSLSRSSIYCRIMSMINYLFFTYFNVNSSCQLSIALEK